MKNAFVLFKVAQFSITSVCIVRVMLDNVWYFCSSGFRQSLQPKFEKV